MNLQSLDWILIIAYFAISLSIGLWSTKKSSESSSEFFLSGRSMPWWLLGVSLVATTFSADTPNLVTDIVRKNGIAGNWVWWAFLLTGMMTVFIYAKLWRRSGILTDLEFYELRYGGKSAAFLRGFRAVYLGVFFNIIIMASVTLAAIKIGGVLLGLSPIQTVLIASVLTLTYSTLGGFRGVILTDFFQFFLAMIGSVWACLYIIDLPEVGGLSNLLSHPQVQLKSNFLPDFSNSAELIPLFILPIAIQWWSVWYPGAEPGGGGYVAQRMLASKNESHAVAATFLFNIMHYALRPWPWILIALASLIVFPDLTKIAQTFPHIPADKINDDLAYSAMLTYLPTGLIGLVVASLIAAYMSTISTHLNWGSSYLVNDVFARFIKPEASEREKVNVGRISTVILMFLASFLALFMSNALDAFNILLQIGAGTGLIFIMRWFWWRINAYSEIAAMVVSFMLALIFTFIVKDAIPGHWQMVLSVGITTIVWIAVTLFTKPESEETLKQFYQKIKPHATGWKPIVEKFKLQTSLEANESSIAYSFIAMLLGCSLVYSLLFMTGFWIYSNWTAMIIAICIASISAFFLIRIWKANRLV